MRKVCFAGKILSRHDGIIASWSWICWQLYRDEKNNDKMMECEKSLLELGINFEELKKRHGY